MSGVDPEGRPEDVLTGAAAFIWCETTGLSPFVQQYQQRATTLRSMPGNPVIRPRPRRGFSSGRPDRYPRRAQQARTELTRERQQREQARRDTWMDWLRSALAFIAGAALAIFTTFLTGSISEQQEERRERQDIYIQFMEAMDEYSAPFEHCELTWYGKQTPNDFFMPYMERRNPAPPWPDPAVLAAAWSKVRLVGPKDLEDAAFAVQNRFSAAQTWCEIFERQPSVVLNDPSRRRGILQGYSRRGGPQRTSLN